MKYRKVFEIDCDSIGMAIAGEINDVLEIKSMYCYSFLLLIFNMKSILTLLLAFIFVHYAADSFSQTVTWQKVYSSTYNLRGWSSAR